MKHNYHRHDLDLLLRSYCLLRESGSSDGKWPPPPMFVHRNLRNRWFAVGWVGFVSCDGMQRAVWVACIVWRVACGGWRVACGGCRRCTWMYGELTEKEAVERVDRALDHHLADQFEILLYKKNRALHSYPVRFLPHLPYAARTCSRCPVASGHHHPMFIYTAYLLSGVSNSRP